VAQRAKANTNGRNGENFIVKTHEGKDQGGKVKELKLDGNAIDQKRLMRSMKNGMLVKKQGESRRQEAISSNEAMVGIINGRRRKLEEEEKPPFKLR
jgi:hypothetical protein